MTEMLYIYIYIYILSSSDRLFRYTTTLECGKTRWNPEAGIETRLTQTTIQDSTTLPRGSHCKLRKFKGLRIIFALCKLIMEINPTVSKNWKTKKSKCDVLLRMWINVKTFLVNNLEVLMKVYKSRKVLMMTLLRYKFITFGLLSFPFLSLSLSLSIYIYIYIYIYI